MEVYYPFFLLLQISLTASQPEGIVIYDGSSDYTLSCGNVTTSFNSKPPRVEWYIHTQKHGSHSLISLNDTNYWWKEYQNDVCRYGSGSFPKFAGPCIYDCTKHTKLNSTVEYVCSYSNNDIRPGDYSCKIFTHQVGNQYKLHVEKSISVEWNQDIAIEPRMRACFMPTAVNFSIELLNKHHAYQINATWDSSKKPYFSTCVRPFCSQSRRYQVKLLIFNSPPHGMASTPDRQTGWLNTIRRRETFYLFEGPQISPEKYYIFQVKNSRRWFTYEPDKDFTQIGSCGVCNFGEQEAAHIIESSNFFNVSNGDSIKLRCRGGGNPAPTVSFLYIHNGDYVTIRKGTTVLELIVYAFKSHEIFCRVNNTIIKPLPCGQVEEFEDITSININVLFRP